MRLHIFFSFFFLVSHLWVTFGLPTNLERRCQPQGKNPYQLTGWKIVTPQSPEGIYYQARLEQNMHFNNSFPCVVVYSRNADDVSNAIQWANFNNWTISVRSGGHSYEGFSAGNGVVIDVHNISSVEIASSGHARVGSGTMLIDLYVALADAGWVVPGGSCPTVGIAGFTLGGGFGYLSRKYGVLSDSLIEAEVVLGDGTTVIANSTHNTDLLWALKGGGNGNFGVVTYFTFILRPMPKTVISMEASWGLEQLHEAVDAWQKWAPFTDERLTSHMQVDTGGAAFAGVFIGPKSTATALFTEFLELVGINSTSKPTLTERTWIETVYWLAGCPDPYKCTHSGVYTAWKAKSDYVTKPFTINGTDTIREWLTIRKENQTHAFAGMIMDSYGGQINKVAPDATAFPHRDTLFVIQYLEYWYWKIDDPIRSQEWIRGFYADMRPHVSGQAYRNYADSDLDDWQHRYYGKNYQRLQTVKQQYDPHNVFHYQQSVQLPSM
eukprot:TRINITY_DN26875_c0_g1_i1.p1 TRINITY_DN26875_c0_g1~~TRINITY_DN26875_c0_g1_i1.p1  ORF type:complete len:494 (+),score=46.38 TRINITY_DN26875_c0_g1_i1:37-1518(+)